MRLLTAPLLALVLAVSTASPLQADDTARDLDSTGGPTAHRIEEKKRRPKPDKEKEKKESEQDEDKGSSCLGGCLWSIFESMLSGDDVEEEEVQPYLPTDLYASEFVPFTGVINPVDPGVETIEVWTQPGGSVLAAEIAATLHRGTRVEVLERRVMGTVPWYRVRSYEPTEAVGWTDYQNVTDEAALTEDLALEDAEGEPPRPTDRQDEPTAAGEIAWPRRPPPAWQILGEIAWDISGRDDLRSEYLPGGVRTGVKLKFSPISSLQIGLATTYSQASGDPQYNYMITFDEDEAPPDSIWDVPLNTHLAILAIGLQAGQHIWIGEGPAYFTWSIGPTLFRVRERADISYTEYEDDIQIGSGERTDEMLKWKVGADAGIGIGCPVGGGASIGATMGLSFIPWDGEQEESLALDWIESNHILLFHIGIMVGYAFGQD
jgi:hypothetical protein